MAHQTEMTPALLDYVRGASLREDDVLSELREETSGLPGGESLQVMAEEGQLLALLVRLVGARSVLEIGTFTGYSTLCMARALPPGGKVTTCDITDRWAEIGAPHWKRAGVEDRIELRVGDAAETLSDLAGKQGPGVFDMVFIDADKKNYPVYYERSFPLVRTGGLIVVDNTLFSGRVADGDARDPDTEAIRELNEALHRDERVDLSLVPMADGITLVRKR
ncbi:class I SAM-dependent methyltransferase [Nocardiopsis akebiae]|uniref:Class I SAM-dependent methyltransferase n=1 Tax=Nocardiopsis akebiae TaxID=2831968 RepID=A0ABX8C4W5_9ACTN|nr:class I SAM-dependent methyltransferase [Nocardiopsis akebiae]QUX28153.1 class I SAM-dependent methyltransferase [Nocardiopsis akebiae]